MRILFLILYVNTPKRIFSVCLIEKPFRKSDITYISFLLSTSSLRSLAPLDKVERKSDFVTSGLACIVLFETKVKRKHRNKIFVNIMSFI